jgi:hypothetical protein
MLNDMQYRSVGSFLGAVRRRQQRTLHYVAKRVGRRGISKQALSLIERGRMRVPSARLSAIKLAYRLSLAEEQELARLYAFEVMVESTGEDREFGEAVLSTIDPKQASAIYVLGSRKVALTSTVLQEKAARFLQGTKNTLAVIYPKIDARCKPGESLWFNNTEHERFELRRAVQAFTKASIERKIRFYEIDTSTPQPSPIIFQLLSLCGPFTATTITANHHTTGYVYVEGPRERWVLLKPENAQRALAVIEGGLVMAQDGNSAIREKRDW